MRSPLLFVTIALAHFVVSTIVPFPGFVGSNGFGSSTAIPRPCVAALNGTINCDPILRILALTGSYISPTATGHAAELCDASCDSSLAAYKSNVLSQCGSPPVIDDQLSNTYMGDLLRDYYELICTKDPGTGGYCVDFLNSSYAALSNVTSWSDLPPDLVCSSCQVSFYKVKQRSPFLGYNAGVALNWLETQKVCNLSFPLDVDPASALNFGPPPKVVSVNISCASGNSYTVRAGETCTSIAIANSVAPATLWAINNLSPDCSAMEIGQSLCLPKQCDLYTLAPDDTCWSIASAKGLSFASILAYNPTINPDCSNLDSDSGSAICISNPEGHSDPPPPRGTNPNAQSQFAVDVSPPPGPTPFGTTNKCGSFYQVQVADTCQRISLAAAVSVELFLQINPSIDANCFNLVPSLWYCVHPIRDWNTTTAVNSTSTTAVPTPAPAPTPPGTTENCYKWHVVVSGDSCWVLQQTAGVTMAQLMLWNPDLHADCSNLLLGEAYCVLGQTASTTVIYS